MKLNVVNFNGSGKCYSHIAEEYIDYISNRNFNLSIDEACLYLSCTYTYFLKNFRDLFKHIYINTPARIMINKSLITTQNDNVDLSLIRKKVLYNKADFQDYIKENMKVEFMYKTIELNCFSECKEYYTLKRLCKNKKVVDVLNYASKVLYGIPEKANILNFKDTNELLPERLVGANELKEILGFKYNTQLYRYLYQYGGKKYRLNSLVRYNTRDFESNYVLVNYSEYEKLNNKLEIMRNIIKQSIKIIKS